MCGNKKLDRRPTRAEIEAKLQQIREKQAKYPVAQDHATGEHPIAKIYKALQTGEQLTTKELQLGRHRVETTIRKDGSPPHPNRQRLRGPIGDKRKGPLKRSLHPNIYQKNGDLEDSWTGLLWM